MSSIKLVTRNSSFVITLAGGLLVLFLFVLNIPSPPARSLDLTVADPQLPLAGFWPPEQNGSDTFRWSDGDATIFLSEYTSSSALVATLRLTQPQDIPADARLLTLRADDRLLGRVAITPEWRVYRVLVAPAGAGWAAPSLDLHNTSTWGGAGDMRSLGVALSAAELRPLPGRLPLYTAQRMLVLALVVLAVWAVVWRATRAGYAIGAALVVGALIVGLWYWNTAFVDGALRSTWGLVLGCGLVVALAGYFPILQQNALVPSESNRRAYNQAGYALLIPPGLLFLILACFSLQWRMSQDTSIMLYLGRLMHTAGLIPYRDFFEQNFLGAFVAHMLVSMLVGSSDLAVRIADLLWLAVLLGLTWLWMRRFGAAVAWCAILLFGLVFLGYGPPMSLQREYLLLLFMIGAFCLADVERLTPAGRLFGIGLLFGLAATLKPHVLIGMPIVLLCVPRRYPWKQHLLRGVPAVLAGLALPALASVLYLWNYAALNPFLDLALNYWPLYSELNIIHRIVVGPERLPYLAGEFLNTLMSHVGFVPALIGSLLAMRSHGLGPEQRRRAFALLGLMLAYAIYPVFAGKFWAYHWLPFVYWVVLVCALCLGEWMAPRMRMLALVALGATLLLRIQPPPELGYQLTGHQPSSPKLERIDTIAGFLRAQAQPGDTVQPLDWTGGAVQAMLMADSQPATRFVEDFYFYHHLSQPYIQGLRAAFLAEFDQAQPRFVIQILSDDKPWASGPDTTRRFPELEQRLETGYVIAQSGEGYRIWERR